MTTDGHGREGHFTNTRPAGSVRAPASAGDSNAATSPLLMTLEEAAEALSVPKSWLRARVAEHRVACTRLGRHIRFTRQQLQELVDLSVQPAVSMPLTGLTRRSRRSA